MISCNKGFLDKKPTSNLNVPTTLPDLQLLLDNTTDLQRSPVLGEQSADDYYMSFSEWNNQFLLKDANAYVWAKDIFAGSGAIADWNLPYKQVLYTNVVLQQLDNISRDASNSIAYDNIKGTALFIRAWSFFDLAQVFALPYDSNTSGSDLGIPIRLTADINAPSTRSTLQQTYDQIVSDTKQACMLISLKTAQANGNRPSKSAGYGLMSRIYLTMRDYKQAGLYADSALSLQPKLIDYNKVDSNATVPFTLNNDEIIYQSYLATANPTLYVITSQGYSIDTILYRSYVKNDLRKKIYFSLNGTYINRKRGYSGSSVISNGLATDELYLTRAECEARNNDNNKALSDLNALLSNRYKNGAFTPITGIQGTALLNTILSERRKELVLRGLRWNDIRRLNKEGYNITLTRNLNGQIYTLPPNDPRYALPIPPDVLSLSGIQQNNR
ncbi:MAG: RagB/SusD family nutrient uptake outer membrane protein [Mucilaginibacter sp.]|uniref:RagB/SusD family nutrient uptake outer membrane protein n=1 Tax=Mucilaginibacter sp. TaxID=1882438 RepID=UPI0032634451